MHKKFKVYLSIVSILLVVISSSFIIKNRICPISNVASDNNEVHLVLDTLHCDMLLKNFRKYSKAIDTKNTKKLNLTGLDTFNASGSAEFSQNNLPSLIKSIDTSLPIGIVDLRQESHGFINGMPISWDNLRNDANIGLNKEQVLANEHAKLKSIKLNTPITFYNQPNLSTVPTTVSNEQNIVKAKSLLYIRIPVTDGKIPTDDMVDYFVELVKSHPKDRWLHFHCKEGEGRTTTFMIMYDMLKNYNQVSADDIINRQLLLANFDEDHIKSFSNNERMTFLKNFYKYVKESAPNFTVKWSTWKKTLTTSSKSFSSVSTCKSASSFIKNPKIPSTLYVISEKNMTKSERTMIATLQGLVNHRCSSQIYTLNSSHPDYKIWLEDLNDNYNIPYKLVMNPWNLVDKFKSYINGYVLYDNKTSKDPSINNACSLASLKNSIAVDKSIENTVVLHGIKKITGDCRNTDKYWGYKTLWNSGLNHSVVIELSPEKESELRDYAIMTKSLIFYEDDAKDVSLRNKVFSSMKNNPVCLGWGPDEFINVSTASKYGVSMIPADWSYNLTVLSAFPSKPIEQKSLSKIPKDKTGHYVTFIMSDGDNQQWYLNSNYSSPKWYGSSLRGNFNLGWSISPSLYYLAPTVFNLYYKNASCGKNSDYFLVPPSGNGYIYPSKFKKDMLNDYIKLLNAYMKKADENYVTIIDDSSFHNIELWNNFTKESNINGLFYLDYARHNNYHGEILWSNNKPLVACRDLLWKGIESEEELVKEINLRVHSGQIGIENPLSYTFVYVHVWSKNMSNIQQVVTKLSKNPKINIVTPEIFMQLIRNNVKH